MITIILGTAHQKSILGKGSPDGKFKEYNGKTCYAILDEVTDAYEVSFVAVPAQRGAGVTKQCAMYNVQCADADIELKIKMAENFIFCLNNFYDKGDF